MTFKAKSLGIDTPILNSLMPSNKLQVDHGVNMIMGKGSRKIGILGFSFKAGTDDLRESPLVEVIERLIGKGYDIKLYDKNVNIATLVGANKDYILNQIPHISNLMCKTKEEVLEHADVVVVGNKAEEFLNILDSMNENQELVDLVRICDSKSDEEKRYEGICW